jgi:hypothetical protein
VFLCVLFVFLVFLVCPTLSRSLDCPFVIAPSVLSNVYMGMIRPFVLATDYQRPLIFSYGSLGVATICILGASEVTFFIQKSVIYLSSWGQTACLILFCIISRWHFRMLSTGSGETSSYLYTRAPTGIEFLNRKCLFPMDTHVAGVFRHSNEVVP